MPSSPRGRMRWSSSTAPISPTASPAGCGARAPSIPILDYVSPSVWAWRPGRARAMRGYVDCVLAILPFEPAAHVRLGGPPCVYVGHPLIERRRTAAQCRRGSSAGARDPPRRSGPAGQPFERNPPADRRFSVRRSRKSRPRMRADGARAADRPAPPARSARRRRRAGRSSPASWSSRRRNGRRFAPRAQRLRHPAR